MKKPKVEVIEELSIDDQLEDIFNLFKPRI
jgi:hypothetical protein